jgi:geranylgeranyl diphosphate synthase, type II
MKRQMERVNCVPHQAEERAALLAQVKRYVGERRLVPPLSMEELREHAAQWSTVPQVLDYVMVLLNNEVWRETVATVPYERRLLLLPQCLRSRDCPAELDAFGLLCEECGGCSIASLQQMAEELGYVVLVAEGSTVVSKLLEGGKVDAVVGVSCLHALEKSFPHMAAEAIPGLAIPLFEEGCIATKVDLAAVEAAIQLKSASGWKNRMDTDALWSEVNGWFDAKQFVMSSKTEEIACDWLLRDGKRWRPFLLACTYRALTGDRAEWPDEVRFLGLAVECFHKASLVHDDIEDADDLRYGEQTLHCSYGVPVALNVGDLLVGEGYRWISRVKDRSGRLLRIAAENHRMLCLGQGAELYGLANEQSFSLEETVEIFRQKTAPAFGVSLQWGAVLAGGDEELCQCLQTYSESLGIAYQIRDDLEEYDAGEVSDFRSSILLAVLRDQWPDGLEGCSMALTPQMRHLLEGQLVVDKVRQLLEHYKNEAIRALNPLQSAPLKSLLRRVTTKMLGGV